MTGFSIGGRLPAVQPALGGGGGGPITLDVARKKLRTRNWSWNIIPRSMDGVSKAWGANGWCIFRVPYSWAERRKLVEEARDGALHQIATHAPAPDANMKKTFKRINAFQDKPGKTLSKCKDEIIALQGNITQLESMRMTLVTNRVPIPTIKDGDRRAILKAQMAEEISRAVTCAYEQACEAANSNGAKVVIDGVVTGIVNRYDEGSLERELAEEVGRVILGNALINAVAPANAVRRFGITWTPAVAAHAQINATNGATLDGVNVPHSTAKSVANFAKDKANAYAKQQMSAVTALTVFTGTPEIAIINSNIKTYQKALEKLTDEVLLSLCNADAHTYSTQNSFDAFYHDMWTTAKELSEETQARLDTLSINLGLPVLRREKREKSAKHYIKQGLKNGVPSPGEVALNAALMGVEYLGFHYLGGGQLPKGTGTVALLGLAAIAHFAAMRAVNWWIDKD